MLYHPRPYRALASGERFALSDGSTYRKGDEPSDLARLLRPESETYPVDDDGRARERDPGLVLIGG